MSMWGKSRNTGKVVAKGKRFVVLGLGSFGRPLAERLAHNGCRVTGVDSNRDVIEDMKDTLYEAVVADVTSRETLEQLSLQDCEAVIISLSEDISKSLLATLHVKELGVRTVIVKGVSAEHEKILRQMKVDRVIFPDREMADELADRMTWPNVLDYLPIDPEYSVVEIAAADSFEGSTLQDADLRRRFGVWVLGIKDALTGQLTLFPKHLIV